MNYKESNQILEEIKKAKRILLKVHRSPDPDSIGSCLAMNYFLQKIGKDSVIIASDPIHKKLLFLKNVNKIKKVDMAKFDYSKYDLFIVLDSSTFDQATGIKGAGLPKINLAVIDHHETNNRYGKINLVDYLGSTCEVLYYFFKDIKFKMDSNIATCLLTGIMSDTGSFQFDYTTVESLNIAAELIKKGADRQKIVRALFHSYGYKLVKLWGEMLGKMRFDHKNRFVWVSVPYNIYTKYGSPEEAKSMAATLFFGSIEGADFGMVMVEQKKRILNISFRSRKGIDVSELAKKLGGSGHHEAAGAWFKFDNFDEAVEKVLRVARKFAKKK